MTILKQKETCSREMDRFLNLIQQKGFVGASEAFMLEFDYTAKETKEILNSLLENIRNQKAIETNA